MSTKQRRDWAIAAIGIIAAIVLLLVSHNGLLEQPDECRDKLMAAGYDKSLAAVQCNSWR